MNKHTLHHSNTTPAIIPTTWQMRQNAESTKNKNTQHKKFTPASRNARINSWHQRLQGLFSRQSY